MDSGVPPTSKRAGSRTSGGGAAKSNEGKGPAGKDAKGPAGKDAKGPAGKHAKGPAGKVDGNGLARRGPIDPRTEDPSSPAGIARAPKTVWRRPGAATPRTAAKHREAGSIEAPLDFSVALPLAPVPSEPEADTTDWAVLDAELFTVAPNGEVVAPEAPSIAPTALVPTTLVPRELAPEHATVPVTMPSAILYDEAATIDDVTRIGPVLDNRPLHRPVRFRRAPKPRVRRVTRVVRHVDTWSVFKVALVFNVFFYAVALVAGVLLWQVAYATGTIDNIQKFFEGFGWTTFKFKGGQIFHNAWIAGLFAAVGLTGLAVLLATLFNLITDLVGGIRFSVLEEEVQTRAERGTELVGDDQVPVVVLEPEVIDDRQNLESPPTSSADEAIAG